jgi:hypothetical protein
VLGDSLPLRVHDDSELTPSLRTAIGNLTVWVAGLTAVAELRRRDIPVLVIKSLPQVEALYGDAGGRLTGDIDIVVPGDRMVEAYKTLVEMGWRLMDEHRLTVLTQTRGVDAAIRASSWHFVSPESDRIPTAIDLHPDWSEVEAKPAITPDLWQTASHVEIDGVDLYLVSPEDRLLILCCHAARSSLGDRVLADIRHALADPNLQWERVAVRAAEAGLTTTVVVTCELALGRPPEVASGWARQSVLRASPWSRMLVWLFRRWRPDPPRGAENQLVFALLSDRWSRKLWHLRTGLIPSREDVGGTYFDHLPTWPEYLAWHARWVRRRARLIASWLRRSPRGPAS